MYPHQQQPTANAARPLSIAPQHTGWQACAIAAHQRNQPDEAALRRQLAAAAHALTGSSVEDDAMVVDLPGRTAFALVDGVRFRWVHGELFVVRPCAHCGLGAFVSLPIHVAEELGFVLSDWKPLHDDCRPFEADEVA